MTGTFTALCHSEYLCTMNRRNSILIVFQTCVYSISLRGLKIKIKWNKSVLRIFLRSSIIRVCSALSKFVYRSKLHMGFTVCFIYVQMPITRRLMMLKYIPFLNVYGGGLRCKINVIYMFYFFLSIVLLISLHKMSVIYNVLQIITGFGNYIVQFNFFLIDNII